LPVCDHAGKAAPTALRKPGTPHVKETGGE
jgi:hypothetical protein